MAKIISDSWVMGEVRNIKASLGFYSKLGLKPAMMMPYYVEFNLPGGTVVGLHSVGRKKASKGKARKSKSAGGWGIMIRVKNLKKVATDLKRKKIPCSKIQGAPGGADFAHIYDPDGNRLILLQMGNGK